VILDPITFELIKNNIDTIVDEMTLTMVRTAYSGNIRDGMDFSAAICDAQGQLVAQGVCVALQLGSIPDAIEVILTKFKGDINPGDVFILNDPFRGGMHLSDIFIFKPMFVGDELVAFLVIVADHVDVGGRAPGSRAVDSVEVFQEGLRIPPLKLYDRGVSVPAIWEFIDINVRIPRKVIGDLHSSLAACLAAERLLTATIDKFGLREVQAFFAQVLDYSERIARQVIRQIPDGHYQFVDHIDDSITSPEPVEIRVALEVAGDTLRFDMAGSSPQVRAAINSTMSFTKSAVYAVVRTLMPTDLPNNAGLFRPIEVTAPLGTILNPREPAAVASRGVTGFRLIDAAFGALAQAIPGKIPAAGEGGASSFRIGGTDADGRPFIIWDSVTGTWGARPDRDGVDGCAHFAGNLANVPIELLEAEFPVRILRYGLRQDSGGAGQFRGGMGLEREWELLGPDAVVTMRADRGKFEPWGMQGGKPGSYARNILNPHTENRTLPSKLTGPLRHRDRFLHQQASGGGFGDPLDRDVEHVLADWRDERISLAHASDAYGTVIDSGTKTVDAEKTAALREKLRAARGG
jgi:N-methylhydantoinase B